MSVSALEERIPSDLLPILVEWAEANEAVRAILLTSTRAIPDAPVDILSDYDVILVVRDIQPWVTDHAWLEDFGQVLVAYWDPIHPDSFTGVDVCSNVVQYTSSLKIDFTLWPVRLLKLVARAPALPAELDAGYVVQLDKDHLTEGMLPPSRKAYVAKPPTLAAFQTLVNDFLSDAPYVAKCLWRDELLPAKWCLDYDMKLVYLRQLLEWRVELDHAWSLPVGALGKGLKKNLSPEIWTSLEHSFAGASLEANWLALDRTLALFRQLAKQVGEALDYGYPEELHAAIVAYVAHIRTL
jgi:aminoglycoside 6-adenylyltransferase